ncbi:hypothetical protein J2T57_001565 [Natronocella acetinitrilica]|uniref:DUF4168 domain-containing protein n=2 Tax=Natronocella acetinitrilica TaxID=414046 RepID=A0AAE3KC34_9GAMM|nr:hypothetical protein [Natronocella acetinitrilica]
MPLKARLQLAAALALLVGATTLHADMHAAPEGHQAPQDGHAAAQAESAPGGEQREVTVEDLHAFVAAEAAVAEIQHNYSAMIEEAAGAEEAEVLTDTAHALMVEAVEDAGLPVAVYNTIAHAAANNPEVATFLADLRD